MTKKEIIVDGVRYVPAEPTPTGTRAVVVVDRGWIFAGDISESVGANGTPYLKLNNATWVFRWSEIGFSGVLEDPKSSKVDLRPMPTPVEVPLASVIFCCPVADDWGM